MEHTVKEHAAKEHTAKTDTKPAVEATVTAHVHTRKKTSSKGSRRLTDIEKRVSRSVRRVSRALDNGVDAYIERRDKSAAARKDGAVVDFVENVSYGVSRMVSDASPLIHDVAETLNTRQFRIQVRRLARTFGNIPLIG